MNINDYYNVLMIAIFICVVVSCLFFLARPEFKPGDRVVVKTLRPGMKIDGYTVTKEFSEFSQTILTIKSITYRSDSYFYTVEENDKYWNECLLWRKANKKDLLRK